jgi:hypothetical protein
VQQAAVHVLAAEPTINTTGVVSWIVTYIVPLLFAFAAVVIMSRAHQGRTRENAVVAVNLFLGIMLIAAATRKQASHVPQATYRAWMGSVYSSGPSQTVSNW